MGESRYGTRENPIIKKMVGFFLYPENHQQCWWFQKALAMSRKRTSFDL